MRLVIQLSGSPSGTPPPSSVGATSEGLAEALGENEGLSLGDPDGDSDALGDRDGDSLGLLLGDSDADGESEGDSEGDSDGLSDGLSDADGESDGLSDGDLLGDSEALGLRLGDSLGLSDGDSDGLGETTGSRRPNTTPVEPASTLDDVAHVLEAMLLPLVVGPEVIAIVQSEPVLVSTSMRVVQSGFVSLDMAAAIVVLSSP